MISPVIMGSPARRLTNPITRCWDQPHNRYAGTDDGPGTGQKLDAERLTLMTGRSWRRQADRRLALFRLAWPGLCPGSGIFAGLVEFGLNSAFAVLFLPSQNLPHHGSLAGLVLYVRILAWFVAGTARRLFWLIHGRILLQSGLSGSSPSQIHRLRDRPRLSCPALMPGDIAIYWAATARCLRHVRMAGRSGVRGEDGAADGRSL